MQLDDQNVVLEDQPAFQICLIQELIDYVSPSCALRKRRSKSHMKVLVALTVADRSCHENGWIDSFPGHKLTGDRAGRSKRSVSSSVNLKDMEMFCDVIHRPGKNEYLSTQAVGKEYFRRFFCNWNDEGDRQRL